jgi:uncharacterized membrane protein
MTAKPLMRVSGWEAFMHGVFAIAATLLVLDIRVPDSVSIDSGSALLTALVEELPRYAAYVMGFLFVGAYWIQTHRMVGWMRGVDHPMLILGLFFLMVIATVPFVTGLLAEYIGLGDGRGQVALVVFTSWQLVLAVLAVVNFSYVSRGARLLKPTIHESALRTYARVAYLGLVIWVVALLAALFIGSAVALILSALILAMFLVVEVPVPVAEPTDGATSSSGDT